MPGSIITSVLNAPYLSAVWNGTATKSGDVLTFTTAHGLQTGNIVYTTSVSSLGFYGIYAIAINGTSINLASSLVNANNNVIQSLSSFPSSSQTFTNVPFAQNMIFSGVIPLSSWQSRSVSSQIFPLSTSVRISAIAPAMIGANDQIQPWFIGLKTLDNSYFCGITGTRVNTTLFRPVVGDTISGFLWAEVGGTPAITVVSGAKLNFRFTINSSKRVVVETLNNSGVWVTNFTSIVLPTNRDPLYFFCNSALNNISITDCQVTYL
jgi:hypothetical protein